jgi:Ser/Thr protein kinase RdoA (MazF antagonist)
MMVVILQFSQLIRSNMTESSHIKVKNLDSLSTIAGQFVSQQLVIDIQPLGNGNINDTFLVTQGPNGGEKFILQRINTRVFSQPALVIQNMRILTEHTQDRLQRDSSRDRRWEIPHVLLTQDGQDHCIDSGGAFWRAISFIGNSYSLDAIEDLQHASEVGYALGTFHNLIGDLPPDKLVDTLEGFHITPRYLRQYEGVIAKANKHTASKSSEVQYCLQFISDRSAWAHVLEDAKSNGKLPLRLMHGDPKVNNVMIDTTTQQAVSMIDLDTVKPGLVHYDIGDCLRSGCNPLGEETDRFASVCFESDLCQAILQAYLVETGEFLTQHDYEYIFDAIRLITFELGLRFFTDHLAGNVYFKVTHPEHNLARALVQFKLVESIEAQEATIRNIIKDML